MQTMAKVAAAPIDHMVGVSGTARAAALHVGCSAGPANAGLLRKDLNRGKLSSTIPIPGRAEIVLTGWLDPGPPVARAWSNEA
jgi:hypothetical protein